MRTSTTFWASVGVAGYMVLASVAVRSVLLLKPPPAAGWFDPRYLEPIIGGACGLLGGLLGACASVFNAKGRRAPVVRWLWVAWPVSILLLGIMLASSSPYRLFLWIPWGILVWLGYIHCRRTH